MQQKVITNNNTEKHYLDMWKRRTYLNIATNSTSLKSDDDQYDFSSDWGVSLQLGYSHRLTKKPLWGMWAIDVPCLDINVNHFKSKCDADGFCYDSSDKNGDYYKTPWNMERWKLTSVWASVPLIPSHLSWHCTTSSSTISR